MDYALHMQLITASKHSFHPHLMQGVPEMFVASPVMKTEIKCIETLELVNRDILPLNSNCCKEEPSLSVLSTSQVV